MSRCRNESLISRFAWIMVAVIILAILTTAWGGIRIFVRAFQQVVESESESALRAGQKLLTDWAAGERTREQTQALLNPEVPNTSWMLLLQDAQGNTVAMTQGADEMLAQMKTDAEAKATIATATAAFRQITGGLLESIFVSDVEVNGRLIGRVTAGRQIALLNDLSFEANGKFVTMLTVLLGIFCVFSWMMGHWVVMPVRRLTRAARALAARDFNVRANEAALGELGQLSRAFNQMSDELQHTIELLAYEKRSMVQMLEGLSEGILALDEHQHEIHRNEAFGHLLGADPQASQTVEAHVRRMLNTCLATRSEQTDTLWRGEVCLEVKVSPIPIRSGAAYGVVALMRDITTQERLEQTRHDYVANITHELRTPLATMRGLIEPLKDGMVENTEDRQRYYGIILGEVMRLSRLVNDLLELSGLQSGRAAIEMEPVDTLQLLEELQDRFVQSYARRGVKLHVELPQTSCVLHANEDRLSQVLTVLLDNALKYTPEGGEVWVRSQGRGPVLRISVQDNGVGIAPEHLPHVFDRFYQTDRSHSDKGNGLGLSIAQEVMEKMQLKLRVTSNEGQGSTFFFDVPIEKE